MSDTCLVCQYRQTFDDGPEFPVNPSCVSGLSYIFECVIPVCWEHTDWIEGYEGWDGLGHLKLVEARRGAVSDGIEEILCWQNRD